VATAAYWTIFQADITILLPFRRILRSWRSRL